MPNTFWNIENPTGTYSELTGAVSSNGTSAAARAYSPASPWPPVLPVSNPVKDRIYVPGDDGYVYEVVLDGGVDTVTLAARRVTRDRMDSETTLDEIWGAIDSAGSYVSDTFNGTIDGTLFRVVGPNGSVTTIDHSRLSIAEQLTDCVLDAAGTNSILGVGLDGIPYAKPRGFISSDVTPMPYLYLSKRTLEDATSAFSRWTERLTEPAPADMGVRGNAAGFVTDGKLTVPALGRVGTLEFENPSTLVPGFYRLTLSIGSIGQVDADFDGFNVEINANENIVQRTLLRGLRGTNISGTEIVEFEVATPSVANWLLQLTFLNYARDDAKGTVRQFRVDGYKLELIATEVYAVDLESENLVSSDPSAVGTWISTIRNNGSHVWVANETGIYPSSDTGRSQLPLSSLLTGSTNEHYDSVVVTSGVTVASNDAYVALPSIPSAHLIVT